MLFLALGTLPAMADDGTTAVEAEGSATHINAKFLILFAEGFNTLESDLVALRDIGLGFGDMFRLNIYATALGVTVDDLLGGATLDPETGEYDFDWEALRTSMTWKQVALLEGIPRNFGQFVSASKRQHGRDEHQPTTATEVKSRTGENESKGGNPNNPGHQRRSDK
jgi:hypothetical protein